MSLAYAEAESRLIPLRQRRMPALNVLCESNVDFPQATTILSAFEEARSLLIGSSVALTNGIAGTVENVWLDELHGLRISIREHAGKWPVSTIKTGGRPESGAPE